MIELITCENFYSIGEKISLDFTSNKSASPHESYYSSMHNRNKKRISLVNAIIGANGSGKTMVLKTLAFFRYLICEAFNSHPDSPIVLEPHATMPHRDTIIGCQFVINDKDRYYYEFKLNKKTIVDETLYAFSFSSNSGRYIRKRIFSRKLKNNGSYSLFGVKEMGVMPEELRTNASVVTLASRQQNNTIARDIYKYWEDTGHNVSSHGYQGLSDHARAVAKMSDDEKPRKLLIQLLNDFGLSISSLSEPEANNLAFNDGKKVLVTHSYKGGLNYNVNYADESFGSKRLIDTLVLCMNALRNLEKAGTVVVIDEIDSSLHPVLVEKIINLFINPKINRYNAQLIFSTHYHKILDDLNKDQIHLIENTNGFTRTNRADYIKGIRIDSSFYYDYCLGRLGGRPNVKIETPLLETDNL